MRRLHDVDDREAELDVGEEALVARRRTGTGSRAAPCCRRSRRCPGSRPSDWKPATRAARAPCRCRRGGSTCAASTSTVCAREEAADAGRELRRPASRCGRTGARTRGSAWSPPTRATRDGRDACPLFRKNGTPCAAAACRAMQLRPPGSRSSSSDRDDARRRLEAAELVERVLGDDAGRPCSAGWRRRPRGRSPAAGRRARRRRTACCRRR